MIVAGPQAILDLQRAAGNRAVAGRVGAPAVQRLLSIGPSDFDKHLGLGARLLGSRTTSEQTPFEAIRSQLATYRDAIKATKRDPAASRELQRSGLEALEALCLEYLQQKVRVGEEGRRALVDRLHLEVTTELAEFAKHASAERYQQSIRDAAPERVGGDQDGAQGPSKRFALKAISATGKRGAVDHSYGQMRDRGERVAATMARYGLSEGEVSSISIFSAGDFQYINPGVVGSSSWLEKNRLKASHQAGDRFQDVDAATINEEAALHTGMAVQGLNKMPRYVGRSYRGARYTPAEFAKSFKAEGSKVGFSTLASSSANKDVALDFTFGLGSGTKPTPDQTVAVITELDDAGVDISDLAMIRSEQEVLILPGSWFELISLRPVDGATEHARLLKAAEDDGQPLPTSIWYAKLRPTSAPEQRLPAKKKLWSGAEAAGSKLPLTATMDEVLAVNPMAGRANRPTMGARALVEEKT